MALEGGHLDIVQLLIEHNASINNPDKDGWTVLHQASLRGYFDMVQLLIEHHASTVTPNK
jgi:ankyrin repeat protein